MEPLEVNAPLDVSYFHTLHADTKGIITLATIDPENSKFKCRYGKYKTLCKEIEDGTENLYFSQNTFKKFSRRIEYLYELTSCYIDIDYYNTDYTQEQILGNIEILVYDEEIPCPTFVIDSGRGLYLIWHLKRLPAEALPTWRTFQQYLYERLKYLGADRKSLDAARILRIDGSMNSKNNKKVQIITHYPIRYDLHQLEKKYLAEVHTQKKSKKTSQHKGKENGKLLYYFNQYSLYYNRFKDLSRLCKLRDYDLKDYHIREIVLFLYRYYSCCYTNDPKQGLQDALELNALFKDPLPEREVIKATLSAEKAYEDATYKYSNATLIEMLVIDPEEQEHLSTIIGTEEKYARNNERRKNERRCEAGITQRQHKRLDTILAILNLKEQNMTQLEISNKLELSTRTIKKYWSMEKEKCSMFYKILVGKRKGEIILIDEMIKSEGIVVTDKGEKLLMEQVAPLTEAEQEKYLTKVPIDLNAKKGLA